MARSLSSPLWRDRQQLLRDIYTPVALTDFSTKAVRLLAQAVTVDTQGTADMDYGKGRFTVTREPALEASEQDELNAIFMPLIEQHPLGAAPAEVLAGTEVILSRTMGRGGFARSALYHEFYQPLGVGDELGMSIPAAEGRALCFFLWRDRRGFSQEDLATFAFLRPHVEQAYQNAEVLAQAGGGASLLEDIGAALSRGLVLLDWQGRVREWSDRGRRLMQIYFPAWRPEARRLPSALTHWVARLLAQETDSKPPVRARAPFQMVGASGRLSVRLVNRRVPGEFLLIFEEQQDAPPPAVLAGLGLTPRECAIATWLAQGKTNPEIATILGANLLTIKVHVLHIYHKLGVETRTAAAMRIVEFWHAGG